ncbi:hypothetical protein V6N11_063880 [Hibiscus sabdariffa]|uniref:Uncharacterized protein n=1 Tax=Hibiscus sabdariffa TaxID=183260 RepID=A0ABR2PM20_9ROSI
MFRSNEANQASWSRSTGGKPGVPQTQIFMPPFGVGLLCDSSAPRAFVPAGARAAMFSAVYVPSGSVVTTGLATDSSSYLVLNGVCQFNTDEFQISQDGPPFSGAEKVGQTERSLLIGEGSKRPCVADNTVNARKRKPRTAPNVYVEPEDLQLKELPLLDNFIESASAAGTGVGAEEEGPADLDLS